MQQGPSVRTLSRCVRRRWSALSHDRDGRTHAGAGRSSASSHRRDTDKDGLTNRFERKVSHTNPRRKDTRPRRLSDRYEVRRSHTNPRRKDTDRDGLKDRFEIRRSHTNPRRKDTDKDGMNDGAELKVHRNPLVADNPVAVPLAAQIPGFVLPDRRSVAH